MTDVSNVERLTEVSQAEVSTFLTRNVIALSFARKKAIKKWKQVDESVSIQWVRENVTKNEVSIFYF